MSPGYPSQAATVASPPPPARRGPKGLRQPRGVSFVILSTRDANGAPARSNTLLAHRGTLRHAARPFQRGNPHDFSSLMFDWIIRKIIGTKNQRAVKKLWPL